VTAAQIFEFADEGFCRSAKRKCLCCGDFFAPDRRNVRHQRYCSKPACREESKARSQRRWLQSPENQNYFQRLRNVPHQFSWIDQRLVREGHLARCGGTQALALYLLLVTVADRQGLSFYSDKTAARLLCLSEAELRHARLGLLQAGLIAYEAPLYQVLSLEPILSAEQPTPRTGQALSIGAILRQILESGGPQQP
jgi:hypothetical protein